jgi:hypothetical protein
MSSASEQQAAGAVAAMDHASHTPYSDPAAYAELVRAVPTEPTELAAVARNVIVHYRASGYELPQETRHEVNSRWVTQILAADQGRHPWPLDQPREVTSRVQGCCRDHTLFCVAAMREHGIPARSRVGFAGYFVEGWHHDHVIVEAWLDGRWRRFDAEVEEPRASLPTPTDIPPDRPGGSGFVTAAQAWTAHRRGEIDPETYGVDPAVPIFRGPRFVFDEVIYEVAHRLGDELLLWDAWGRIGEPGSPVTDQDARWLDDVAALLLAADAGDLDAEHRLRAMYRTDEGLHPGATVVQASPFGDDPIQVALERT